MTDDDHQPFEFDFGHDGPSLKAAVYQALGAASVCWENMNATGVFQSERAIQIGERLLAYIHEENAA